MDLELFGEYGRARAALPLSNYSYVSKTVQLYTSLSLIINYGSKTVCNKYIIIMMLHVWCALPPLSSCDNLSLLNNWSIWTMTPVVYVSPHWQLQSQTLTWGECVSASGSLYIYLFLDLASVKCVAVLLQQEDGYTLTWLLCGYCVPHDITTAIIIILIFLWTPVEYLISRWALSTSRWQL